MAADSCSLKLQIPQWITPGVFYIVFNVHPESTKKIKDYWRTQGQKRDINKISPDNRSGYSHFFTNSSTNAKYLPFYKVFYFIHFAKLKNIRIK